MKNKTRKSWHVWAIAASFSLSIVNAAPALATDNGFEVGNAQGFFGLGGISLMPAWNGLYGKMTEKQADTSKTRLRMRTFQKVRYDAFRELRRVLEPKGWESIRADGLDAMEREGFGHGEGRCIFEVRFLNDDQELVAADYEAVPRCTIEQAMKAIEDSLRAESLIR